MDTKYLRLFGAIHELQWLSKLNSIVERSLIVEVNLLLELWEAVPRESRNIEFEGCSHFTLKRRNKVDIIKQALIWFETISKLDSTLWKIWGSCFK